MEIGYEIYEKMRRCKIKEWWENAGRSGTCIGKIRVHHYANWWAIVIWDDDFNKPDYHSIQGLDFE